MNPKPTRSRLRRLLTSAPLLGLLAWGGGLVGIWYLVQSNQQSPGVLIMAATGWTLLFGLIVRDTVSNLFGPVFVYEITRLGRRRLTFILRILYVVCILLLLGMMYASWLESLRYSYGPQGRIYQNTSNIQPESMARFAYQFFLVFVMFQYGVAAFLTPAYVAGTIADEKERKTLEFLLATDLQPREIIFGKVAARVTNLIMYVLAGLPIIAFLQLFGGIEPDLVLATSAATIITILGFAGISIYFSTIMRKPRDAIVMSYMTIGFYLIVSIAAALGTLGLQTGLSRGGISPMLNIGGQLIDMTFVTDRLHDVAEWFAAGNVGWSLARMRIAAGIGGTPFTPAVINTELMRFTLFWGSVTVLTIGTAIWRLRPIALRQGSGGNKVTRKAMRLAKDRPAIGDNPVSWKEVLVERGSVGSGIIGLFISVATTGAVIGSAVFITYLAFVFPYIKNQSIDLNDRWDEYVEAMNAWVRGVTGCLATLCLLGVAIRASTSISGERDKDTWLSLISTPLSSHEILVGKWLGAVLSVRKLYRAMILVWAAGLSIGAVDPIMLLPTILYLVIAVSTFAWMGLYWSVVSRTSLIAVIRAFMAAVFMAGGFWLLLTCCAVPLSLMQVGLYGDRSFEMNLTQIGMGITPGFSIGWLPLHQFDDLEPFQQTHYRAEGTIGPWAILLGMIVWAGLCWLFYSMTLWNFARVSLRMSDAINRRRRQRKTTPGASNHHKLNEPEV